MPITLTYDVDQSTALANDRNRVNACFNRLGWEHIGGSAWRYPALGTSNVSEDWFNQVVPALMYFRSVAIRAGWNVTKFTIDAHSEAGHRSGVSLGEPIRDADSVTMYPHTATVLSESRLRDFIRAASTSV